MPKHFRKRRDLSRYLGRLSTRSIRGYPQEPEEGRNRATGPATFDLASPASSFQLHKPAESPRGDAANLCSREEQSPEPLFKKERRAGDKKKRA